MTPQRRSSPDGSVPPFWLVLAGISLAAFLGTVNDVMESPGTDLRCRVVGARAMMLGMDPYFMPAKTDQVQTLQDPDRYAAVCTRCTYAPTLLCLYMPFANLSYQGAALHLVRHRMVHWPGRSYCCGKRSGAA